MSPAAGVVPDGPLIIGIDGSDRARDAIALGLQLAIALPGGIEAIRIHTLEGLDALMTARRPHEFEQAVAEDGDAKLSEARTLAAQMGIEEVGADAPGRDGVGGLLSASPVAVAAVNGVLGTELQSALEGAASFPASDPPAVWTWEVAPVNKGTRTD